MSEQVRRAVVAAIETEGPLTFAAYMEHVLYGPGGFYERLPVGESGDFVTSPHVHPVFGELLAGALLELWHALGRPDPWDVAEVGAGDGTLARQLVAALADTPIRYSAVEASTGARDALTEAGIARVHASLEPPADVVVANELLDNLPFRVVRGGREVRVGLADGDLTEVLTDLDDELADLVMPADDDADQVVPVGAFAFVDRLAEVLPPRGYALLIDYGATGSPGGPLHGYRDHRVVEDVLAAPGTTDVTAGVDFDAIAERAASRGLRAFPTVRQLDALLALGFEEWFRGELTRQHDALNARDGLAAIRTWSGRSRASLLIDPGAMGRFRWLLVATPDLPAPPWLESARSGPTADRPTDPPAASVRP